MNLPGWVFPRTPKIDWSQQPMPTAVRGGLRWGDDARDGVPFEEYQWFDCLFCGDPCEVRPTGSMCGDCGAYADWNPETERWKVYVPKHLVPYLVWVIDPESKPLDLSGGKATPEYLALFETGKVSYWNGETGEWSAAYLTEQDGTEASGVDKYSRESVRLRWDDSDGMWRAVANAWSPE